MPPRFRPERRQPLSQCNSAGRPDLFRFQVAMGSLSRGVHTGHRPDRPIDRDAWRQTSCDWEDYREPRNPAGANGPPSPSKLPPARSNATLSKTLPPGDIAERTVSRRINSGSSALRARQPGPAACSSIKRMPERIHSIRRAWVGKCLFSTDHSKLASRIDRPGHIARVAGPWILYFPVTCFIQQPRNCTQPGGVSLGRDSSAVIERLQKRVLPSSQNECALGYCPKEANQWEKHRARFRAGRTPYPNRGQEKNRFGLRY